MGVSFSSFEQNYSNGLTQLVWRWLSSDLETPVSAYLKLCADRPYGFLLESVEGGAVLGRYSVIGFDPDVIWRDEDHADPLTSLKALLASCHIDIAPEDLPPMAASGMFGYLGYDMVRLVEEIPDSNPDELGIPRSILIRPQILLIFDNIKHRMCIVTPVYKHGKNNAESANIVYKAAQARLDVVEAKLKNVIEPKLLQQSSKLKTPLIVSSNTTQPEYSAMVESAMEHIRAGDIFQVVLGQRFSVDFDLPAFSLYRALRALNPSPFMTYLAFEGFSLVASSPEILVRVRDNIVTIRPIAGTRPRGQTPAEDAALAQELLADPKERAEHLMLLDLGRNDVGRVAEFGSVSVTESFVIEYYSHVMHIVSNVEGRLREDLDIIDAHFSGFPAGTVSGAPKVRAMEIIDELEKSRRSYYGGSMGYFSGNREMDSCIALRTALVKDGKVYVQAGAGIVADSNPEAEYQETINKARAIIRAAELAVEQAQTAPSP